MFLSLTQITSFSHTHIKNTKVETLTSKTYMMMAEDGETKHLQISNKCTLPVITGHTLCFHFFFLFLSFFFCPKTERKYSTLFISVATVQSLPLPRHSDGYLIPEPEESNRDASSKFGVTPIISILTTLVSGLCENKTLTPLRRKCHGSRV